jgi:hypothetical protein
MTAGRLADTKTYSRKRSPATWAAQQMRMACTQALLQATSYADKHTLAPVSQIIGGLRVHARVLRGDMNAMMLMQMSSRGAAWQTITCCSST